jgi:hypothetical protein
MEATAETRSVPSPPSSKQPGSERRQAVSQLAYGEEVLIIDARAHLTPAQMVERKLLGLMKATSLPVSCVRSAPRFRSR